MIDKRAIPIKEELNIIANLTKDYVPTSEYDKICMHCYNIMELLSTFYNSIDNTN